MIVLIKMVRRNNTGLRTKKQAQCTACGEVFGSTSTFDKHLVDARDPECRDPKDLGMVYGSTGWKMPTPPGKENWWEKLKEDRDDSSGTSPTDDH